MEKKKIKFDTKRLRSLLKDKKKTHQWLCDGAKIPFGTLRYCLHDGEITPDNLYKIANYLNVGIKYLQGVSDDKNDLEGNYDHLWMSKLDPFTVWIDSIKESVRVRYNEFSEEDVLRFKDKIDGYSLSRAISETNEWYADNGLPLYDSNGNKISDDAYDEWMLETLDFLHDQVAEYCKRDLRRYGYQNDLTIKFMNIPALTNNQELLLNIELKKCLSRFLDEQGLTSYSQPIYSTTKQLHNPTEDFKENDIYISPEDLKKIGRE